MSRRRYAGEFRVILAGGRRGRVRGNKRKASGTATGGLSMNGIHDLGGMQGFGPVVREKDEPVFHAEWERRTFGLLTATLALQRWNIDEFRHAIERMGAAHYLESSYYEH